VKVLFTNHSLAHHTGTEVYVLELARSLLARGHQPVAWSPVVGPLAAEFAAAGVPVTSDLAAVERPDLIHGHHHLETLTALLAFPGVPGLAVCHGAVPWEEAPLRFPRLLRYVAVDEPTRRRLREEGGIPPERIAGVPTFVDLERFRPRPPLPDRPRRALAFSNNARPDGYVTEVRAACAAAGIGLDVIGIAAGREEARPELVLPDYDLVFAKGRAALEAMAVGAAVVLCDAGGCGPLVTTASLERLRPLNFGYQTLTEPVTAATVGREIARYDAGEAGEVSRALRETAGLGAAVDGYLALYAEVLEEAREQGGERRDDGAELRAAADYLAWLNPALKERARLLIDRDELWRRLAARDAALAESEHVRRVLEHTLAELRGSATWRLHERLAGRPFLRAAWRLLKRLRPG